MTEQQAASRLVADEPALAVETRGFPAAVPAAAAAPYGVLDVGSNSIRLVVFEGLTRAPAPIFNERELCGLGATLAETGALAPDAVEPALDALRRFAAAADALGVGPLDAVTTAAVRDAIDGARFCAVVARETGFSLRVLTGEEEARYAALGVVSAFPAASGLMADLGGGSLELVRLEQGRLAEHATLPLGVLRLGSLAPARRAALAAERLKALPWLGRVRGEPVYLVGGAWRALARLRMAAERHPIPVVHHFRMTPAEARAAAKEFAAADPATLRPGPEGMWPRRLATVPSGASVLKALLKAAAPGEVLFSAFGLREGLLFDRLPPAVQAEHPLLDACRAIARRDGRALAYAEALGAWLERGRPFVVQPWIARTMTARQSCASGLLRPFFGQPAVVEIVELDPTRFPTGRERRPRHGARSSNASPARSPVRRPPPAGPRRSCPAPPSGAAPRDVPRPRTSPPTTPTCAREPCNRAASARPIRRPTGRGSRSSGPRIPESRPARPLPRARGFPGRRPGRPR